MTANEEHSHEPLDEWQLGVFEDSTDKTREVLVALGAVETSILGHLAVMLAAVWANNITVSPT